MVGLSNRERGPLVLRHPPGADPPQAGAQDELSNHGLLSVSVQPQQAPSRLLVLILRPDLPVKQALQAGRVDALALQHHAVKGLELLLPRLVGLDVLPLRILAGGHALSIRRAGSGDKAFARAPS